MALVPAWDKKTGEPLAHLVPARWEGTPLAAGITYTDPKQKAAPDADKAPKGRDPKEA